MNDNVDSVTLHQNILMRPENLVASAEVEAIERLVVRDGGNWNSLGYETFECNHLTMQLFQEAVTNATDNYEKSKQAKIAPGVIEVTVTPKTVTVYNEGLAMSCDFLKDKAIYNPHCALFTLLSSTNYKKNSASTTGGRNGVGGTCCSIFSNHSSVEIYNTVSGIHYFQETNRNMYDVGEPQVTTAKPSKVETSWFKFAYDLDFDTVFNHKNTAEGKDKVPSGYTEQMVRLFARIAMEAAAASSAPITFNGHKYSFPTLKHFGDVVMGSLFPEIPIKKQSCLYFGGKEFQTSIAVYDTPMRGMKFAYCNGLPNPKGGSHVDKLICDKLDPLFKKTSLGAKCTPTKLKKNVSVFISCRIPVDDLSYDGQRKEKLTAKGYTFSFTKEEKASIISTVEKWNAIIAIANMNEDKLMKNLSDELAGNKGHHCSIDGGWDAKWAGHDGWDCKLIICEGKSTVESILKGVDCKTHGVLPLSGKIMNTSKSSKNEDGIDKKYVNKIVMLILKAIGLSPNTDYTQQSNFKKLNYKQVYIMTDADPDGDHIKVLICNLFRSTFPDLFKRPGFLTVCYTPLIKLEAKKNIQPLFFFDVPSFDAWKLVAGNDIAEYKVPLYFKGLGSYGDKNVKHMHSQMKKESYVCDATTEPMMALAMDLGHEDSRKKWITNHRKTRLGSSVFSDGTMTKFVCETMMRYATAAVDRHIPSLVDGFKPCQRKIYWTALNHTKPASPMQSILFIGEVMRHTAYHHGESPLYGAITAMISTYMGLNNYPLMYGDGQFGSVVNPRPSASRYTKCSISELGKRLMPQDFQTLLEFNYEGEIKVEPKNVFFPLPMFAINGCGSVAVGWKSCFPCYNLEQIKIWVKTYLANKMAAPAVHEFPPIDPHFKYFEGTVRKIISPSKPKGYYYVSEGNFKTFHQKSKVVVTGFPIGTTCKSYMKKLDAKKKLYSDKGKRLTTKNMAEAAPGEDRDSITLRPEIEIIGHDQPITLDTLGLRSTIDDKNIVLIGEQGEVLKFDNIHDALLKWADTMYAKYQLLKDRMQEILSKECGYLSSKKRFISDIREEKFSLSSLKGLTSRQMKDSLVDRGYMEEFVSVTILQTTDQPFLELANKLANVENRLSYYKDSQIAKIWLDQLNDLIPHMK